MLVMYIFREGNVFVLSRARDIGSASFRVAAGYLSTSSRKRYFTAFDARLDGELLPAIVRYIPSNCSSRFLDWYSLKSFFKLGESFAIVWILFSDTESPSVSVG